MKMKKLVSLMLVLALIGSLLAACGSKQEQEEPAATGEPVVIKYAVLDPEDSIVGQGVLKFKETVETQSNGQMKVEIYFNGQLGGERQVVESMPMGVVQMSGVGTQVLSNFDPVFAMTDLPFVFKNKQHYYDAVDGDLGELYKQKANEVGLEMMQITDSGSRIIANNVREIKTPADLKDIKMRVPEAELYSNTFTAWGANVTPLSFTEIYTALQQGAVDGMDCPTELIWALKFMEVQKYLTISNHMETAICIIADKKFYDGLTPEQQTILQDAAKVENAFIREYLVTEEAKYIQEIKDSGKVVTELTQEQRDVFAEASKPVVDAYVSKYNLQNFYDAISKYE